MNFGQTISILIAMLAVAPALGQDAFSYQGHLLDGGQPANGTYDLQFRLFGSADSGGPVLATATVDDVAVSAGLFTASVDFGPGLFQGDDRWLLVAVRLAGGTTYTDVLPLQQILPTPHSHFADAVSWSSILDMPAGFADGVDDQSDSGTWGTSGDNIYTLNNGDVGIGTSSPQFDMHVYRLETAGAAEPPLTLGMQWKVAGIGTVPEDWLYFRVGGGSPLPAGHHGSHVIREQGVKLHFSTEGAMQQGPLDPVVTMTDDKLGINKAEPLGLLHVARVDYGLLPGAISADEIVVEGSDSIIGLYSTAGGSWGSAIAMGEHNNGVLANKWGIHRRTSGAGGDLRFTYGTSNDTAANSTVMTLKTNGAVSIGTTVVPSGVKLAVDGKGLFEEVEVQLSQDWPDYVFEDDYPLMPLDELERAVREHKHLPGIPSADEVATHGIAVGQMQSDLLRKIEELTLYTIEQNNRLQAMEQHNQALLQRLESLENRD